MHGTHIKGRSVGRPLFLYLLFDVILQQ